MTLDEAIEYALVESKRAETTGTCLPSSGAERNGLSPRERELAILIAQVKSNPEIADTLVVSERTVTTHVTHIFSKLGFTSRTQVAAWAAAQQLTHA